MKKEDKFKVVSILEGVIIIILLVVLISTTKGSKTTLEPNSTNNNTKEEQEPVNEFVGIYHATNYNKTYNEVNITLNKDYSCKFSVYDTSPYNCSYEVLDNDKVKITFRAWAFAESLGGFYNRRGTTKEECLNKLKELQEKLAGQGYENYKTCEEYTEEHEATLTNGGLLYEEKLYYKIK